MQENLSIIHLSYPPSSPVRTAACCFVQQDLHIWEFLEPLCSNSNIALPRHQLLCGGHCEALQSTEPERSTKWNDCRNQNNLTMYEDLLHTLIVTHTVCIFLSPAHSSCAKHGLFRNEPQDLLKIFLHGSGNDQTQGRTEDVPVPKYTEYDRDKEE